MPHSDGLLNIIRRIVLRLEQHEHFLRFLCVVPVVEGETLAALPTSKDIVTFLDNIGRHLQNPDIDAVHCLGIAAALHPNNRIYDPRPIKITTPCKKGC